MSKIYMAVTVCQDKNETTLPREHTRNAAPVITLMFCLARPGTTSNLRLTASAVYVLPTFAAQRKRRRSLWKPGTLDIKQTGNICLIPRRFKGGGPRLIILFIILLPFVVIWETAKKS